MKDLSSIATTTNLSRTDSAMEWMGSMRSGPKRRFLGGEKRGAKMKLKDGKKRHIWISDTNFAWLKKIGDGNARLGLSRLFTANNKFENKN